MRFQLKNFGIFREADLKIPWLTVIVGENGTGQRKSLQLETRDGASEES